MVGVVPFEVLHWLLRDWLDTDRSVGRLHSAPGEGSQNEVHSEHTPSVHSGTPTGNQTDPGYDSQCENPSMQNMWVGLAPCKRGSWWQWEESPTTPDQWTCRLFIILTHVRPTHPTAAEPRRAKCGQTGWVGHVFHSYNQRSRLECQL